MNFYCDSSGQLLHVDPERVYQGSAMANTIRFIGAFPLSAQVLVAYQLPNGIWTARQMMTANETLSGVQDSNGAAYSVWESKIGVLYEVQNGQTVAVPDYRITANYGTVLVQFYVYAGNGESAGTKLATASSSFLVEKGVPVNIPTTPTYDYESLLQQILSALQVITETQSLLNASIAANTNVLLAHNGTMYLYLNPRLTAEDIYMKLLPNAVEIDTNEGGVLLYGKNTGEWKRYFWSEITALFPDKVKTSPDGTTDCLYFDTSDILVYDATDNTLKIVQVGDFNSLTQIALFGHYYGNITGKLVEANARNLQYMVNDFFMQDETATVLTFEFGEEGGSVTLDLANTQYSSVYFDQYARIPTAGSTTVRFTFAKGRHYVTLINNTALSGVNNSSFITVGKENLIAVKISTLVNDIGKGAFEGCTALKKADIPFSATRENGVIEDYAFSDCPLGAVEIPEGFIEVGNECFTAVKAQEIELPTSLNAFAGFAFNSLYIEKIICKNTNPVWTTPEEESPFTNALLIVPHDSVETYKSVFGYDKVEAYAYIPKGYRLIRDITLEEDVLQIDVTTDDSGNPLKLKAVFITFFGGFTGEAGQRVLTLKLNGGVLYQMYYAPNITANYLTNRFMWIKSNRLDEIPNRNIFVSQYSELLRVNQGASFNLIQGLDGMNSTLRSDYGEPSTQHRSINRIAFGQRNDTLGLMAAGSRIFIWGIDDNE